MGSRGIRRRKPCRPLRDSPDDGAQMLVADTPNEYSTLTPYGAARHGHVPREAHPTRDRRGPTGLAATQGSSPGERHQPRPLRLRVRHRQAPSDRNQFPGFSGAKSLPYQHRGSDKRRATDTGATVDDDELTPGEAFLKLTHEVGDSRDPLRRATVGNRKRDVARIAARTNWRFSRKSGPDKDGYERFSCPALGHNPRLCCPTREKTLGKVPVLFPPEVPPKICTQETITIAPDIGARWRQDLAFGSERWASTYASYRNTIEGLNGYAKDPAHEALGAPGRRRVRGIAAQSIFVALLLMAANFRKTATFREMRTNGTSRQIAQRARRRRTTLASYRR